ncbi:MAG TPA: hypothetical protein VGL71_08820 [Urbifossiella sp.]
MPKKVAAVVTEYRRWCHADVILRNLLTGYPPDGKTRPDLELVSLYTDQVPKTDLSRGLAKKHGFKICDTIAEALTLGTNKLAVEGVLSIGEHGDYPHNEKGQHLYPRRRFFEEITGVFEKTGQSVPVFNDKHLAPTGDDAKWMYDRARKLMVPFLAGSSVPTAWRLPKLILPKGSELLGTVQIGYGPVEAYGFHALEGLQCMVERRKGGETGVKAVTFRDSAAMWDVLDRHDWTGPLIEAAAKLVPDHAKDDLRTMTKKEKEAGLFEVEYRDGLRAFVVIANGWAKDGGGGPFAFATQVRGEAKPAACRFYLQGVDPFSHFAELTRAIDSLIRTGHAPYPVERTLLTTGILDAAMTSRFKKGERQEPPHLDVKYQPTEWGPATSELPKG